MLITYELTNENARKALFTCVVYTNKRDGGKQGRLQIDDAYVYWCAIVLVPGSKEEKVLAKAQVACYSK